MSLYVYFIQADFTGLIKIGKSIQPSQRLQSLQAENADNLKLIGLMRAEERTEALLHSYFKKWRFHGEWFQPATEIFSYIAIHSDPALVRACLAKVRIEEEVFPTIIQKCLNCGDKAYNNQYCSHPCRLAAWAEEHGKAYWNKLLH